MVNWYPVFLAAVALLWFISSERDRPAARIVLIATIGSEILVEGVTRHIAAPWKLLFPAGLETATILCLLTWARNRTGNLQAALLSIAWLAHALCYFDVETGTDLVYSRYEGIVEGIAVAQLAGFYDTLRVNLRKIGEWIGSTRSRRLGDLRAASICHPVLPPPRFPRV